MLLRVLVFVLALSIVESYEKYSVFQDLKGIVNQNVVYHRKQRALWLVEIILNAGLGPGWLNQICPPNLVSNTKVLTGKAVNSFIGNNCKTNGSKIIAAHCIQNKDERIRKRSRDILIMFGTYDLNVIPLIPKWCPKLRILFLLYFGLMPQDD